ncbi:nitrate reductase molybdenum cofactor assembly chaperone [Saccharopolyspora hirsuta]|uniref:Nitrate reductase molybdenum cofactor assembly chaperone n=1 Tax=Saccharopolyspora hirsuta TaxID=1837 RepID=A0A5M7C7Y1_SACHI|nr:nitrate reductase molybdenum cofactor assembly chaperone [Saccharopolyspora hirsuta]KAA5838122.1 nitrate reductase molybdenum cofactor assembly chaperone [Saccharopolyspora hirsuta]
MKRRRLNARTRGLVRQIAAWCLHYPDAELVRQLPLLREATAELGDLPTAEPLHRLLDHLAGTPLPVAEQHYIEVFDVSPRRSLYLTWFVHGDTRLRGGALAELAGIFRAHGFRIADGELPDYLPALLEFSVAAADPGEALLGRFRPAIELLHRKLGEVDTPYAGAVLAVLDAVPRSRETAAVPAQAPTELVGLQPFLLREGSR